MFHLFEESGGDFESCAHSGNSQKTREEDGGVCAAEVCKAEVWMRKSMTDPHFYDE